MFTVTLWGKRSYPHFTEGKAEAQRESLPVSPPTPLPLEGKWLLDTPGAGHRTHWGQEGPQWLYLRDSGGTEPQSGKEVTWMWIP